ncbi:Amino-acid permease BAT1 [Coccomyxa sp. Obi]|nr:Amino-acid permease BAT1 [Coccomyxa sp. Obi]
MSIDVESRVVDSGQSRLEELGYKQELRRTFGFRSSCCASITVMSCITSISASLSMAYKDGYPVASVWGWVAVSFANLLLGTAMAELLSAYPICGGPYLWCLELTDNGPKWALVGWLTGWFNVVGQFAMTAANAYITAKTLTLVWLLAGGHVPTNSDIFLIYAVCLLFVGMAASLPTDAMQIFAVSSGAFLVASGAFIITVLPMLAPKMQPASFVFFGATDGTSATAPSNTYLFLLALPMANFAYISPLTPMQFSEETRRADTTAPQAVIWSIAASAVLGMGFLLSVLFCIQDPSTVLSGQADGNIVGQVFHDVFLGRFGTPVGGIVLLGVLLVMCINSTVISMVTNARAFWAFSREGAIPLHRVWSAVNACTGTPVNAVWAMTAAAFLMGLPILASPDALGCNATAIAIVCLDISYCVPLLLRVVYHSNFEPGPFNLTRLQPFLNIAAFSFTTVIAVIFLLPMGIPVTQTTSNWTPLALVLTATVAVTIWYLPGIVLHLIICLRRIELN